MREMHKRGLPTMQVSILLVPGFMLSALALFTDALRLANWRSGKTMFVWQTWSPDNESVTANDGTVLTPSASIGQPTRPEAIFVAAGFSPETALTSSVLKVLRAADRNHAILGGWDTGSIVLAEAGLMGGHEMALHWQAMPAVHDRYPDITLFQDRLATGRRRYTGPGGVSTFDLAVELIRATIEPSIADMVVHSANRYLSSDLPDSPDTTRKAGRVLRGAVRIMEQNMAPPISIPVLAGNLGTSPRSLSRLFQERFRQSPHQYYLSLRLHHAANLIRQSQMSMLEISVLSGFASASRFSQAFRNRFNQSPSDYRKKTSWMRVEPSDRPAYKLLTTLEDQ